MTSTPINPAAIIKVMHVDDSSIVRRMVEGFFEEDGHIKVVAAAENGMIALDLLDTHKPDIIILDVEMPVMDGITALPLILKKQPNVKVIMCSSLTERGASISMQALSLGALDCIAKPTAASNSENKFGDFREQILRTVRGLFPEKRRLLSPYVLADQKKNITENMTAKMLRISERPIGETKDRIVLKQPLPPSPETTSEDRDIFSGLPQASPEHSESFRIYKDPLAYTGKPDIIAIGSSTGGPTALFEVLKHLKGLDIPIVITQHMPPTFTKLLAEHIQQNTGIPSQEGAEGMVIKGGNVYVAPGGFHMLLTQKDSSNVKITLNNGPQINFCKPAVDPMFESLVTIYGKKILATILTGMGNDGLVGSKYIVQAKGRVIAQNKETSTVWGMPRAVTLANICCEVLPLNEIGPWIKKQTQRL
jgi:two-component system chemotaxis response regulator CheB